MNLLKQQMTAGEKHYLKTIVVGQLWRVLYKSPLTKRSGGLQWRILHGGVVFNPFVCVINLNVDSA